MDLLAKGWVKRGLLQKRAQGKSIITHWCFRTRTFILTETALLYFSGADLRRLTLKGTVPLPEVRGVEIVNGTECFGRPHMFQVVHNDAILYLQANSPSERADWCECWGGEREREREGEREREREREREEEEEEKVCMYVCVCVCVHRSTHPILSSAKDRGHSQHLRAARKCVSQDGDVPPSCLQQGGLELLRRKEP